MYTSPNTNPVGILISNSVDKNMIPGLSEQMDFSDLHFCATLLMSFLDGGSTNLRLIQDDKLVYVIQAYRDGEAELLTVTRNFTKDNNPRGTLDPEIQHIGIMYDLATKLLGVAVFPSHPDPDNTDYAARYKKEVEDTVSYAIKCAAYLCCNFKSEGDMDELFCNLEPSRMH